MGDTEGERSGGGAPEDAALSETQRKWTTAVMNLLNLAATKTAAIHALQQVHRSAVDAMSEVRDELQGTEAQPDDRTRLHDLSEAQVDALSEPLQAKVRGLVGAREGALAELGSYGRYLEDYDALFGAESDKNLMSRLSRQEQDEMVEALCESFPEAERAAFDGVGFDLDDSRAVPLLPVPKGRIMPLDYFRVLRASIRMCEVDPEMLTGLDEIETRVAEDPDGDFARAIARQFSKPSLNAVLAVIELHKSSGGTQRAANNLLWLLGGLRTEPGVGSTNIKIGADGRLEGRFSGFPAETKEVLLDEFRRERGITAAPAAMAERHVIPAHMMTQSFNRLAELFRASDDEPIRDGVARASRKIGEMLDAVVATYRARLEADPGDAKAKLFIDIHDAAAAKIAARTTGREAEEGSSGGARSKRQKKIYDEEQAKLVLAMYMMNGNPENLWHGNASTNSSIPSSYDVLAETLGKIREAGRALADIEDESDLRAQIKSHIAQAQTDLTAQARGKNRVVEAHMLALAQPADAADADPEPPSVLASIEAEMARAFAGLDLARSVAAGRDPGELEASEAALHENFTAHYAGLETPKALARHFAELTEAVVKDAISVMEIDFIPDAQRAHEAGLAMPKIGKQSVALGQRTAERAAGAELGTPEAERADLLKMMMSLLLYDELDSRFAPEQRAFNAIAEDLAALDRDRYSWSKLRLHGTGQNAYLASAIPSPAPPPADDATEPPDDLMPTDGPPPPGGPVYEERLRALAAKVETAKHLKGSGQVDAYAAVSAEIDTEIGLLRPLLAALRPEAQTPVFSDDMIAQPPAEPPPLSLDLSEMGPPPTESGGGGPSGPPPPPAGGGPTLKRKAESQDVSEVDPPETARGGDEIPEVMEGLDDLSSESTGPSSGPPDDDLGSSRSG